MDDFFSIPSSLFLFSSGSCCLHFFFKLEAVLIFKYKLFFSNDRSPHQIKRLHPGPKQISFISKPQNLRKSLERNLLKALEYDFTVSIWSLHLSKVSGYFVASSLSISTTCHTWSFKNGQTNDQQFKGFIAPNTMWVFLISYFNLLEKPKRLHPYWIWHQLPAPRAWCHHLPGRTTPPNET